MASRSLLYRSLNTLGLAAGLMLAAATQASVLIGTEYAGATPLYTMNQATGTAVAGPATGVSAVGDLASSGTDNVVFAIAIDSNTLYRFDAATGATLGSVVVQNNPAGAAAQKIVSIAYDAANGVIYGNSTVGIGGGNGLFRINPLTGAAALVGFLQVDPIYALAFDAVTGTLYGANGEAGDPSSLWTIDTTNAAVNLVGRLATEGNFDIAIRPEDGQMFLASTSANALYLVDKSDASQTLVGDYGAPTNIAGLAFVNGSRVPEPASWALLLGALGLLRWQRWR